MRGEQRKVGPDEVKSVKGIRVSVGTKRIGYV